MAMSMPDATDRKIIETLRANSRTSFLEIARQLGVSEGTVRKRVKNLVERKVIRKFTLEEAYDTTAIIEIVTSTQVGTDGIVKELRTVPGMQTVMEVAGRFTILCMVKTKAKGLDEVNDIIEQIRIIKGVLQTETFPVLRQG